jgi:hypothetical protein
MPFGAVSCCRQNAPKESTKEGTKESTHDKNVDHSLEGPRRAAQRR